MNVYEIEGNKPIRSVFVQSYKNTYICYFEEYFLIIQKHPKNNGQAGYELEEEVKVFGIWRKNRNL